MPADLRPRFLRSLSSAAAVLAAAALLPCAQARGAKVPQPFAVIAMADLGYQSVLPRYLLAGDSMFTVHFVDEKHLLFTYTTHGLIQRLPDAEPDDQDRNVAAVLLEVPSGRVLARTEWHLRDHARYLWPLEHGRFLLRIRDHLTIFAPLANLDSGHAFKAEEQVQTSRHLGFISISPTGDLLTVETIPKPKPVEKLVGGAASAAALAATQAGAAGPPNLQRRTEPPEAETPPPSIRVEVNFFRMKWEPAGSGKLVLESAGHLRTRSMIEVPADGAGFIDIKRESRGVYLFDFMSHGTGKRIELSPMDTTCAPRPYLVSPTDFFAVGCRGDVTHQQVEAFNLRGEATWISAFQERGYFLSFRAAPAAGRFALSRTTLVSGATGGEEIQVSLVPENVSAQEVTFIQNSSGRVLFRTLTTPFQRAGQNFDLSPDGLQAVVVRAEKIELYRLPTLTAQDLAELKKAEAFRPRDTLARIDLGAKPVTVSRGDEEVDASYASPSTVPAERKPTAAEATSAPAEQQKLTAPSAVQPAPSIEPTQSPQRAAEDSVSGDQPTEKRKPPTLYDDQHPKPPK